MITIGSISLSLPFVHSKKERRAIINHIIDKLKRKNISVMDSSGEYPHEALITFTFIRADKLSSDKTIEKIEELVFERVSDELFDIEYEIC